MPIYDQKFPPKLLSKSIANRDPTSLKKNMCSGEEHTYENKSIYTRIWRQSASAWIPVTPRSNCVAFGKMLNLSEPSVSSSIK